jgi:hypothetical protein
VSAEPDGPAPAFYAMQPGGWRDYWTLLHPPYTAWHLSYVLLGAAAAPRIHGDRLAGTLIAFFLGVGIGAHALDELKDRPLRTRIPNGLLRAGAAFSIGAAVGIGLVALDRISLTLLPFLIFGAFIVWAYNFEIAGGVFHTDFWFAFAWGAFPAFTGYWTQALTLRAQGVLVAAACFALSAAQRSLSTPVRTLRRRTVRIEGEIESVGGDIEHINRTVLTRAPEQALRWLSIALPLLGAGAITARMLG